MPLESSPQQSLARYKRHEFNSQLSLQHSCKSAAIRRIMAGGLPRSNYRRICWQASSQSIRTLGDRRINNIVKNLTASAIHLSHGKMITAADIANDPDLKYLKIKSLAGTDPYWILLDDLLQRTDVVAKQQGLGKILMAREFHMVGG